jgi:Protein of unknown function (DUF2505)
LLYGVRVSTEFRFEHVFRVASPRVLVDAYFDADHLATQDAHVELGDRVVVESDDDGAVRRCVWRVTSLRPLPMVARPLVSGGRLRYLESMTWRRDTGDTERVEMTVSPEILGGRVQVAGTYQLSALGDGRVQRVYAGSITANIKLLSSRIERGILETFTAAMPAMAACTQGWLDRVGHATSRSNP